MKSHESYASNANFEKVRGVLLSFWLLSQSFRPCDEKAICSSTFSVRWGTTRVPYPEEDKKTAIECVDELDRKMPFSVEPCKSWQQSTKITTHLQKCILGCPNKKLYPRYYSSRCCFLNSNLSVKTLDVEGTNINVLRPFDQLHDPIRVWKMWWFFAWVSEPYG